MDHRWMRNTGLVAVLLLLGIVLVPGAWAADQELTIFHAGSLAVPFKRMAEAFEAEHPGVKVRLEAAGSRACARKITDLGKPCDIMASADYAVIDTLLIPDQATWNLKFAANELGIAYRAASRRAADLATGTWPEIFLDPAVAYGRSDPDADPCGYRTVLLFRLAEKELARPGLADQLLAKDHRFIRPKETDLLALLESGAIDYLVIYRSVAVQHGLPFLRLPPGLNLADPGLAGLYGSVEIELTGSEPGTRIRQRGEPIVYALTIPKNAPNPALAKAFIAFLARPDKGGAILAADGQEPLTPLRVRDLQALPEELRPLAREEK